MRFSLKHLLGAVLVVSVAAFLLKTGDQSLFYTVVAVNILGWCLGWFVTNVCGLPRDGSLRGESHEEEAPVAIAGRVEAPVVREDSSS